MTQKNKLIVSIVGVLIITAAGVFSYTKKTSHTLPVLSETKQNIIDTKTETLPVLSKTKQDTIDTKTENLPVALATSSKPFIKPSLAVLRKILTPIQYEVTQEDGTETPYNNLYAHYTEAGIYVDIISGEPLFSSKDKYDSGTGWPSFVKPISQNAVIEKTDTILLVSRTEIRSRIADSHLGHVFEDGPQDRGGKRYCMNSAALKFIPKADMGKLGYSKYLISVE